MSKHEGRKLSRTPATSDSVWRSRVGGFTGRVRTQFSSDLVVPCSSMTSGTFTSTGPELGEGRTIRIREVYNVEVFGRSVHDSKSVSCLYRWPSVPETTLYPVSISIRDLGLTDSDEKMSTILNPVYWIGETSSQRSRHSTALCLLDECPNETLNFTYDTFGNRSVPTTLELPLHEMCLLLPICSRSQLPVPVSSTQKSTLLFIFYLTSWEFFPGYRVSPV